ncbi:MAG TPA: hypothetical protein PKC76_06485 [Saprospiraceae bacterium]|nr:hypothetical protein [Saprospiraceae bacterium]HMP23758.1 hypothetical protein [Saprospiraceae bacterium]
MITQQIVTITFFRYRGLRQRWWAFGQMGLAPKALRAIQGLQFGKMLGSGSGNGFSVLPNLGVYGLLAVWDTEHDARHFFDTHPLFKTYCTQSAEQWTLFMRAVMAHGQWDGVEPFRASGQADDEQPVGVLTRATIYPRHLWRFWRFVPPVSRSVERREGLVFSVGVGELPLIQQATFSLWQSTHLMKAYAYQSRYHSEVVKKTRELGWYSEELFARFAPYAEEGSWQGLRPLQQARQLT